MSSSSSFAQDGLKLRTNGSVASLASKKEHDEVGKARCIGAEAACSARGVVLGVVQTAAFDITDNEERLAQLKFKYLNRVIYFVLLVMLIFYLVFIVGQYGAGALVPRTLAELSRARDQIQGRPQEPTNFHHHGDESNE